MEILYNLVLSILIGHSSFILLLHGHIVQGVVFTPPVCEAPGVVFTPPVCEVPGLCSLHQCARSQGCVHSTSVRGPRVVFTPPVCEAPGVVFTPPVCEVPGLCSLHQCVRRPGLCSLHQCARSQGCVHSTSV